MNTVSVGKKALNKGRQFIGGLENQYFGVEVMKEEWDVLLILDGCRFDMFDRLNTLEGTLEWRRSGGSATREFVQNNFVGGQFYNTVYVTANPFISLDASDAFHDIFHVWRTDWDVTYGTVRPESVRDALLRADEMYPNKRIVGHFMQPHHPFIGPSADGFRHLTSGFEPTRNRLLETDTSKIEGDPVWQLLERGTVKLNTVKRAYEENLELVLECAETVLKSVAGLSVVTSDHGNLLDEPAYDLLPMWNRRYGHPKYASAKSLVKVPWLVQSSDERRHVTSESPVVGREEIEKDMVEDRLEALGYK
jgi:exonuclease VII small subunit